jgi:hypothetical protein
MDAVAGTRRLFLGARLALLVTLAGKARPGRLRRQNIPFRALLG